jgi:putative hydrolase of the HAD superfamily
VLFDFFGTITQALTVPTDHGPVAAVLGVPAEAFQRVMRASFVERASGRYGGLADTLRWAAAQLDASPSHAQVEVAIGLRVAWETKVAVLRANAVHVAATIQAAGVATGVVSDCTHELPMIWSRLAIAPHVDAAVFSVNVGRCKPDPLIYRTACRRLGVAPERCWFVGDGGSQELTGARAVGMTAIQLVEADSAAHRARDAERDWPGAKISSLSELPGLLQRIRERGRHTHT